MDQFNFNSFPATNFNEVNLSWMLEVMTQFKEDIESGQFVGPQGPQGPKGDPGPAGDGLSEDVKQALLQLARKVAYIDAGGQSYYQDLYDALYGTTPTELVSISAAYTQTGTVYDTDSLESLKTDLIVTGTYSDSSTAVIPAADYTLSGSLTVGTSTITVSYSGKTDTFDVTVTASAVTLVSISAAFNQGSAVIYESDSLDSLKQYLTVTATYSDSTTATIPSTDYTLSGTLTEGTSTITVSYRGKTDTFQVTVTADPVPVTLVSISAAYTQSGTVYDTDSLNSLKADLIVTATYSDSSTAVIPSSDYTLSGTLTAGTSTITVSYQGKTDTFQVTVTAAILYQVTNHSVDKTQGFIDTEIQLLSTDRDFSILFDGIQPAAVPKGAAVRLFTCISAASSWKGIFCGASASASQYALQWYDGSTGNTVGLYRNAENKRFRIAYVHESGSDQVIVKVKVDDGTIVMKNLSSAFISQDGHLLIGGDASDNSTNWIGTITNCKVYGIAVDSTTLNTFFA